MYMIVGLNVGNMTVAEGTVEFVNPTTLDNGIRNGMYMLVTLIPAICLLICCIPMFFYDITGKKKERMLADLAAARKERGIHIEDGEDEPEVFTEEYETELHAHESDNADMAEAAACENAEDKIEEREE